MLTDCRKAPSISIILPAYNGLPYIEECVNSVLSQSYQDWELLISDDGSKDGTREWLRGFHDRRIRVFEQEENLGIMGNLNFLFKQAQAPVTHILGQDDYFLNDALSRIVEAWARQPADIGFIRFNWNDRCIGRKTLAPFILKAIPERVDPKDSDLYFFIFGCFVGNISNISVRTQLIECCGGFNQELPYAGDMDFWTRLARRFSLHLSAENVSYVRVHPGQASKYLNRKGELIHQLREILVDLHARLAGRVPPRLFKLHATLTYDALQRDVGVKMLLLRRESTYLSRVNAAARDNPALFGIMGCWIVFLLSLGGRVGRGLSARLMLWAVRNRNSGGEHQS